MSDYQEDEFSPRELLSIVDDDHDFENPWWNVVWYLQERPHGVVNWIRKATSVNPSLAETVYLRGAVGRAEAELSAYMTKDRRLRAVFLELSEHGDLTPTGKRVLNNILDGES